VQGSRAETEGAGTTGPGTTLARVAGVGALIVAIVLAAVLLLRGDSGHQYKLLFETGGQLVPGNQVLVGGRPIGTIDEIKLTDDAQAEVTITVDEPLHQGTTAMIRTTSLSGVANRYISVAPGPNSEDEIPDGATLTSDVTRSPVDIDQLFNTFNKKTRNGLRDFIRGQAAVYTGNNAEARETYKYFAPSLQAGERLFAELNRDQFVLSRFFVSGSRVLGAVAERRDDLSALTENANRFLGAIARENVALDRALTELPPAMRQANTTFVNLRAALDDLDPLFADFGRVAPDLPGFLRDLRPVARDAAPVLADLELAVSRPGGENDLTENLRDLPAADASASRAVPRAVQALDDSQHIFEFARPYSPDLAALITKLGTGSGFYDFSGHYLRAQPAGSNIFDYNEVTEQLEPIPMSQMFDAYGTLGTGPFVRCPGGATQPNAGWPAPEDHPFLDEPNLTGDCDPNDVPPGP
jgi:phospholipid/cholesterol/gamma-HCH transport system substrate-binding protein